MPESRCKYESQCAAYLAVAPKREAVKGSRIRQSYLETVCVSDQVASGDCVLYKGLAETTIDWVKKLRDREILSNPGYR